MLETKQANDGLDSIDPLYQIIKQEQLGLYTWILCDVFTEKEGAERKKRRKKELAT